MSPSEAPGSTHAAPVDDRYAITETGIKRHRLDLDVLDVLRDCQENAERILEAITPPAVLEIAQILLQRETLLGPELEQSARPHVEPLT